MTYALATLMILAAIAVAYARRAQRAEAATILIVALPVVFSVAYNAQPWYRSLRANSRLDPSDAVALAPPVMTAKRNLPLARQALVSIAPDGTYAVVPRVRGRRSTATARRERAHNTYLESWLQYWLAPRIEVDPPDAQWLILLDVGGLPPPEGATEIYAFGKDVLVRRW